MNSPLKMKKSPTALKNPPHPRASKVTGGGGGGGGKTPWKSYSKLSNKDKSQQKQIITIERNNDSPGTDVLSS